MAVAGRNSLAKRESGRAAPAGAKETDGRRARSLRTRAAIVDAFLALLRETGAVPTAAQIAKRAGCSTRSVFERFDDFRSLYAASFDHILQSGLAIPVGDMPARDRATRIAFQVKVRGTNCENWLPLWRVLMHLDVESDEELKVRIDIVRSMSRARVELMYAPELTSVSRGQREATLIAIEALTDYESWGRMREHYALSFEDAGALLARHGQEGVLRGPRIDHGAAHVISRRAGHREQSGGHESARRGFGDADRLLAAFQLGADLLGEGKQGVHRSILPGEDAEVQRYLPAHPDRPITMVFEVVPGVGMGEDREVAAVHREPRHEGCELLVPEMDLEAELRMRTDGLFVEAPHLDLEALLDRLPQRPRRISRCSIEVDVAVPIDDLWCVHASTLC